MKKEFPLAYLPQETKEYMVFEEKKHQVDDLLEKTVKEINIQGHRVLDYGCGFGRMVPMLLRQGAREVVGCDPSEAMITEARRRLDAGKFGKEPSVHFDVLSVLPTSYKDASFDGVLLRFVFHYIVDTLSVLKELSRVLTPNGWLVAIFSDVHVKPGAEYLVNTPLPLKFLDGLTIETLVKQGSEVVENAKRAGFKIERYENIADATVVSIDSSYPHIDQIERFDTSFLVARKAY